MKNMPRYKQEILNQILAAAAKRMDLVGQSIYADIALMHLMAVSGKPKQEVIDFVSSIALCAEDVYRFYLVFGRFPTNNECKIIYSIGADNYFSVIKQSITFPHEQ